MTRPFGLFAAAVAALVLASFTAPVLAREPMLIEGKTTLYERVLTRPGARVETTIDAGDGQALAPFTPLYVYQRLPVDGGGSAYLEVGTDTEGSVLGFLREDEETIPWRHSLVLAFAEPVNRDRTLFFDTEESLAAWQQAPDLAARADAARDAIDAGKLDPSSPVVAVEPEGVVDFETEFYMLPVLEASSTRLPSGFRVRNVRVASITKDEATALPMRRRVDPSALDEFRAGVVFVIDASNSMQPYIDKTRDVMQGVSRRVEAEGLADRVRFGLVAYRDDPDAVEGVEYLVRTFADPNEVADGAAFADATAPLRASPVSTRAFAEDAYAAIDQAFNGIDWGDFGARSLVLVTDASAREGDSPFSSTKLNVGEVRQLVERNGAAVYVLHLQTPVGSDDHPIGEAQYRQLAAYPGLAEPLYFPIPAGDPALFEEQVARLAEALVRQVREARREVEAPDRGEASAAPSSGLDRAARQVGRAMALRYLGRTAGVQAPQMFEAWAADRDLANPDVASFSVRLLVSKNQLSDLQRTLQLTVDALEAGQIDPDDLFNQLRSASAAMGRDPSKVGQADARNLAETGLMAEYLEGLPYQSRLMSLTEDDWFRMGLGDQQAIIDDAISKIRLFQRFHDDTEHWIALNDGDDPGDHVYPVPIDVLP
ncbi:MAG: vWA domain-containing protein [Pseudomonadota bacterium]